MAQSSEIVAFLGQHRKSGILLGGLLALGLTLLYLLHDRSSIFEEIEAEIAAASEEIRVIRADLEFFAAYQAKSGEIGRVIEQSVKEPGDALATLASHARRHGLFAMSYEADGTERVWEGQDRAIDQTAIKLTLQATHEHQIFELLDTLTADWGGQLFIRDVDFSRAGAEAVNADRLSATITMEWRRLVEL